MKLSAEFTKREAHDSTFEGKYVGAEQAITVEVSPYDTLANTHRDGLAERSMRPPRETGRPDWQTFFGNTHSGGFFTFW